MPIIYHIRRLTQKSCNSGYDSWRDNHAPRSKQHIKITFHILVQAKKKTRKTSTHHRDDSRMMVTKTLIFMCQLVKLKTIRLPHIISIKLHFFQLCVGNFELFHETAVLLLQSSQSITRRVFFTQMALEAHVLTREAQNFFLKFTCAVQFECNLGLMKQGRKWQTFDG